MHVDKRERNSLVRLIAVVIAGEAIFVLPFLLPRVFRPTLLEAWQLDNLHFGWAFTTYGMVALLSYLFGGPLADRFQPRVLMTLALIATAAGGLGLLGRPTPLRLCLVYGWFGLTTIWLFWSAMIRITHDLGGTRQATAFGLLDGGRGLFAAVLATVLTVVLGGMVEPDSPDNGLRSVQTILLLAGGSVVATAAVVWWSIPGHEAAPRVRRAFDFAAVGQVAKEPGLYLTGWIVLCAYCGYKAIDNYGVFTVDVLGYGKMEAARLTSVVFWLRPPAAILAGLVADRVRVKPFLVVTLVVAALGHVALATLEGPLAIYALLLVTLMTTAAAVFGLRGVYFALLDRVPLPPARIGTAAGIVSVIGFTPDIFFGTLTGWLIDQGPAGHRWAFAGVALALGTATLAAAVLPNRGDPPNPTSP